MPAGVRGACRSLQVRRCKFFFVFLSFPLNFGGLTELFMLDRMLQEALHCFNPELVSHSSAVPTWESLFGGSVGFVPRFCSVSDLTLPGAVVWWIQKTWWDSSSRTDPALP